MSGAQASGLLQFIPFVIVLPLMLIPIVVLRKMGYSGWWTILLFIPIVDIGFAIYIAAATWPLERTVKRLQESIAVLQAAKSQDV